tara:strand:- start:412 stop:549 length:138 start_codon:yes stop_codon:yes gene_type:complete
MTPSDTKKSGKCGISSQASKAETGLYGTYFLLIKDISTNTKNMLI